MQETFLQAAREAQFRIREDFNGEEQEGLGIYQVTQKNGERWSAARGYIHPHHGNAARICASRPRAHATRILFEGKRAVGVEYRQGKETKQIRARREVILSSGAFQTPQLLMLSGVGDGAALAKHGIATVHHLPGVGQNLQDHPDFVFGFTSDAPHFAGLSFGGIARIFKGDRAIPARAARTDDLELRRMRRLPQDAARPRRARHPAAFLHGDGRTITAASRAGAPASPATSACCGPKSRGSVWLQSADPLQAPAIDPNFLGEAADLEAMVAGFKTTRRLLEAPALKALQTTDMFTAGVESDDDIREVLRAARRHRLSPGRHLQDGRQRSAWRWSIRS